MLFILSEKTFVKKAKKFAAAKNYIICDCLDESSSQLTNYSNMITMTGFQPDLKVMRWYKKESDEVDSSKAKELVEKFLRNKQMRTGFMSAVNTFIEKDGDFNIYIILRNKTYKAFGKKILKRAMKLYPVDFDFIFMEDDIQRDKKILKEDLKGKKVKALAEVHKDLEKKLRKKKK